MRAAVDVIGAGMFRLEIDEAATYHTISYNAQVNIILSELNGGRRVVGAASNTDGFVRGINGNLWHSAPSAWSDTGIPIVGVPAVLQRSTEHPFDVFYKDSTKPGWPPPSSVQPTGTPLRHAFLTSSGWQNEEMPELRLISDPVAVSPEPGRWDVVAIASDYRRLRESLGHELRERRSWWAQE